MVARLLDRMLLERAGHKAVEMCSLLAFILWLSISYVVDRFLDGVLLERVRGGGVLGNSFLSASWSA